MACDDSGLFDMRQMSALIYQDETRIGQALAPQRRIDRRHDLVIVAPDNERR